ncbi:ABC transporter ATP-binding protein [Xanthobacter sp. TB0136]|uniref:ABC transporter ATP-binding protein n=1 Tax=Xanthobacter sp. TB0136 TaxID=3459177 RepID=UPI00403A31EB
MTAQAPIVPTGTFALRCASLVSGVLFGRETAEWMKPVLARAMPGVGLVLATSLLAAALGLAVPMLTMALIDQGIMARDLSALFFWAAMSFLAGLGSVGLGMVNSMLHLRASVHMLAELRASVLSAALHQDPAQPPMPLGEAAARIDGDTSEIQRFAFDSVLVAVGAMFRLVGGVIMMASLDWRLVLLPVLTAPLELVFLAWARRTTTHHAEVTREIRGGLSSHMMESLAATSMLRSLNATPLRVNDFRHRQNGQVTALMKQRLWNDTVSSISQIITAVTRTGVLLYGGYLVYLGQWQIGALVAFLAYTGMMTGPLRNMLGLYHAQARAQVAMRRLSGVVGMARAPQPGAPAPEVGQIVFQEARARHGQHLPVSFTLRKGERVLLDGPSGIGKSRLMSLLTRAAPLECGHVKLGGQDVGRLRPEGLAECITHIEQRPVILHGTLAMNLRIAAPLAEAAALWHVLKLTDLEDWARQRQGLETRLGEAGHDLSGGLRQRIALARALLRPAQVMILDESFSEIDPASCRLILSRLEEAFPERTMIFIAHSGPVRERAFTQRITLSSSAPVLRRSRGETPMRRDRAREKAVWSE